MNVRLAAILGVAAAVVIAAAVYDLTEDDAAAQYKFDDGLYQKIQDLISEEPQDGDFGVYDGERYYNVIMVVYGTENKDSIVEYLDQLGARDVATAKSLSFVTTSVPVAEIPKLSLRDEIYSIGDGELTVEPGWTLD